MKAKKIFVSVTIGFFVSLPVYAVDLKTVSTHLYESSTLLVKLISFASVLVGLIMLSTALAGYKEHRRNPKFIPLDRPIFYTILGIVLIFLPYMGRYFGQTYNPLDKEHHLKKKLHQHHKLDIDEPLY